jgi:hypothetical protein
VREPISLAVIALVWALTAVLLILRDQAAMRASAGWELCSQKLDIAEKMLGEALAELSAADPDRSRTLARQFRQMVTLIDMADRDPAVDVERPRSG